MDGFTDLTNVPSPPPYPMGSIQGLGYQSQLPMSSSFTFNNQTQNTSFNPQYFIPSQQNNMFNGTQGTPATYFPPGSPFNQVNVAQLHPSCQGSASVGKQKLTVSKREETPEEPEETSGYTETENNCSAEFITHNFFNQMFHLQSSNSGRAKEFFANASKSVDFSREEQWQNFVSCVPDPTIYTPQAIRFIMFQMDVFSKRIEAFEASVNEQINKKRKLPKIDTSTHYTRFKIDRDLASLSFQEFWLDAKMEGLRKIHVYMVLEKLYASRARCKLTRQLIPGPVMDEIQTFLDEFVKMLVAPSSTTIWYIRGYSEDAEKKGKGKEELVQLKKTIPDVFIYALIIRLCDVITRVDNPTNDVHVTEFDKDIRKKLSESLRRLRRGTTEKTHLQSYTEDQFSLIVENFNISHRKIALRDTHRD